jgi:hypothetical protein
LSIRMVAEVSGRARIRTPPTFTLKVAIRLPSAFGPNPVGRPA